MIILSAIDEIGAEIDALEHAPSPAKGLAQDSLRKAARHDALAREATATGVRGYARAIMHQSIAYRHIAAALEHLADIYEVLLEGAE